jgi:hypothetical protein
LAIPCTNAFRRIVFVAALLPLWLPLAGCGSAGKSPATSEPTIAVTREPSIPIIPLGRTAAATGAEVTIHGFRLSTDEGGSGPPDGFVWLLVDVEVHNLTASPFVLGVRLLDALDQDFGRAHPPGASAELEAPIASGATVRGETAFLVQRGAIAATLLYSAGEATWALQLGIPPVGH